MILFFDTETTGLPPKGAHYKDNADVFPYIVDIAWIVTGDDGNILDSNRYIIRPDGYEIPIEATEIHGISNEQAVAEGKNAKDVLRKFIMAAMKCDKIVAHNIYFDTSVIKSVLIRLGIPEEKFEDALSKEKRIDTMRKTITFADAKYADGRPGKWPKLEELYMKLFGEEMIDAHTALSDVENLVKCYFELKRLNIL